MTEPDQQLAMLFKNVDSIPDGGFSQSTMQAIEKDQLKRNLLLACCGLLGAFILIATAWHLELAELIAYALTSPLFTLGDSFFSWMFSPINNLGALLVALFKLVQVALGGRRARHVSLLPF